MGESVRCGLATTPSHCDERSVGPILEEKGTELLEREVGSLVSLALPRQALGKGQHGLWTQHERLVGSGLWCLLVL